MLRWGAPALLLAAPNALKAQAANPPAYGAVIQFRPGATDTPFVNMDFTGLDINSTARSPFDPVYYPDGAFTQQYGGNTYGAASSYYLLFGYDYVWNGVHLDVTGSSTYKVQWTVPNGIDSMGMDTGAPDLTSFPVPPLFFLGHVQASIQAQLYSNGTGVSATGKLLDPWTASADAPGISGPVTSFLYADNKAPIARGRGIIAASFDPNDATKTLLQALFSPAPYLTMNTDDPDLDGADGEIDLDIHTHGYVLELTDTRQPAPAVGARTLEIFGHPKARGDGKNQFVYDSTGTLYLPVGINVNGAQGDVTSDDTDYLIHPGKVQVVSNIVYAQPQPSTYMAPPNAATTIVPQTPVNNGGSYNGLVYAGLPSDNAAMGNQKVALQVNLNGWKTSEVANIQTFFLPGNTTHPTPAGDGPTPNWFWYYRDADQTPVKYAGDGSAISAVGFTDYNNIYLYDRANSPHAISTFSIFVDPDTGRRLVRKSGQLDIKGLYSYLQVVGHELGHNSNHAAGIEVSGGGGDNDGVLDSWEAANNFDPMSNDTSGAYGILPAGNPDAGKGDRECLCDIVGLGYLIAAHNKKAWQQDWAVGGMQWGTLPPTRQNGSDYFPWTFTPYDPITNTFGDPTGVIPANVLTSLSQLDGHGLIP